jgi:hypothetical protein
MGWFSLKGTTALLAPDLCAVEHLPGSAGRKILVSPREANERSIIGMTYMKFLRWERFIVQTI